MSNSDRLTPEKMQRQSPALESRDFPFLKDDTPCTECHKMILKNTRVRATHSFITREERIEVDGIPGTRSTARILITHWPSCPPSEDVNQIE